MLNRHCYHVTKGAKKVGAVVQQSGIADKVNFGLTGRGDSHRHIRITFTEQGLKLVVDGESERQDIHVVTKEPRSLGALLFKKFPGLVEIR